MEILFGFNHHKSKVFLLVALLMTLVHVYFLRKGDYWPCFFFIELFLIPVFMCSLHRGQVITQFFVQDSGF